MWILAHQGMLSGQPKSLGRPRISRGGRAYTPQSSRDYQKKHLADLGEAPFKLLGPIRIQITFVSKRPQRLQRKVDPDSRIWKDTKPDLDNMIKMVMDIFTKWGIWADDAQVVSIQAEDYYCGKNEEPHTVFQLYTQQE